MIMNETKKSVKHVLVLDLEAFKQLEWINTVMENSIFRQRLVGYLSGVPKEDCAQDTDGWKNECIADLFWQAYGKEVADE